MNQFSAVRETATLSGRHVVVMGVSGSGKTTLSAQLARALACEACDADDFHPPINVEKMRRGEPLTDEDRAPWLVSLNRLLCDAQMSRRGIVLACSALKESYRQTLAANVPSLCWVFLDGDQETIAERIRGRSAHTDHYMPESLLDSQFETLERPRDAIVIDISLPTTAQVECVLASMRSVDGRELSAASVI